MGFPSWSLGTRKGQLFIPSPSSAWEPVIMAGSARPTFNSSRFPAPGGAQCAPYKYLTISFVGAVREPPLQVDFHGKACGYQD